MEGTIGNQKGTLIKYNEVFKRLNIPKKYLLEFVLDGIPLVTVYLTKVEEIKIGKIVPNMINFKRESSVIFITIEDFKQKLGLKYDYFGVQIYFKEKTTFLCLGSGLFSEALKYYLDKDSEQVYLWISEEDADKRQERVFVETK